MVFSRPRHGRPVFLGARDHIAHRLVWAGLSIRAAVRLMYVGAASLAWLGLVISQSTPKVGFMLLGFVGALGLYFGTILSRIPVEDVIDSREAAIAPEDVAPAQLTDAPPHLDPDAAPPTRAN